MNPETYRKANDMNVEIAAIPDKPILCASFRGRLTVATISAALAEIDTAMDGNPAGWLIFRTYQVESMSQPAAKHLLRWITSSAKSGRLRGTAYCPNNDAMTTGSRLMSTNGCSRSAPDV